MRTVSLMLAGCAAAFAAAAAHAQAYPHKSIRLVIPFAPGGPRDVQARLIGAKLTQAWGQAIIIDNRAGANGIIGTELAAKADPDGYTLLMISAGFAVNATLYPKLPYDSVRDFAAIAQLTTGPGLVVVTPALPVKSIPELIAYVRARPGKVFYASSGSGSPSHLAGELLKMMTHTDLVHVPYKGMAPGINDVVSGQVQVSIPTIPAGLALSRAGKLRALAVTGTQRSRAAPELPTVAEAGVPGYAATNWYGLSAPARTPAAIIAKLNAEIVRVLATREISDRLTDIGMDPAPSTPARLSELVVSEIAKWAQVIRAVGLRPE